MISLNNLKEFVSEDVKGVKGIKFEDMGISKELLLGIKECGYYNPTPVQEESIPAILKNLHVIARAKNGTGKTASFLIPLIEKINMGISKVQCIVIVPTRELALQTCEIAMKLGKYKMLKAYALFGGSEIDKDLKALNSGVTLLISTPGRLVDFCKRKLIDISNICGIALDEADVVISSDNFMIETLLSLVAGKCQILLFSATFPRSVCEFKNKYMKNSVQINTMNELTLKGVTQFYAHVEEAEKLNCLYTLLKRLKINQSIIFCNSITRVDTLNSKLLEAGISCGCIHSKMSQKNRTETFENFKNSKFRILICSDVFNRGIDIRSVNVVINFDLPKKSATYLHRIGRSGRFGYIGLGISFVTSFDKEDFYAIVGSLDAKVTPIPKDVKIDPRLYAYSI